MRKRLSSLYIEVYIGKIKKSSAKQQKTVVLWHIYKGWCIIIVKNADEIILLEQQWMYIIEMKSVNV